MQQMCLDIDTEENKQINNLILDDFLSHNLNFLSVYEVVCHNFIFFFIIMT